MPAAEVALNFVPPLPGKTAASSVVGLLADPQQVQDAIDASLVRVETPPPPAVPIGRRLLDWVPSSFAEVIESMDSPPKPDLADVISDAEAAAPPLEQSPPVYFQSPPVEPASPPPPAPVEALPPLQAVPPKSSDLPEPAQVSMLGLLIMHGFGAQEPSCFMLLHALC